MIKNWIQFNEDKQLDLFQDTPYERPELVHGNLYSMSEEDIRDYLTEIEDEKYIVEVNFGFLNNDIKYTESITNRNMRPCVLVSITPAHDVKNYDVTTCLTSFFKRVKNKFKEIRIYDADDTKIDIKDLILKDGIFVKSENEQLEIQLPLDIQLIWFSDVYITDKLLFEYYGFDDSNVKFTEKGEAQVGFPRDTISDWVLVSWMAMAVSKRSSFKEVIDDPDFDFDYHYDRSSDWIPEHDSFFTYHLEKETIKDLLELCFKDFDELKKEHPDNDFLNEYESKEQLINNMVNVKDRWSKSYTKLGKFLDEFEPGNNIYNELRTMYADWSVSAKADSDYKEIFNEFDEIVEKELNTKIVEKYDNEEQKSIRLENGDRKIVKYDRPYYRLLFNIDWVVESDSSDLFNLDLEEYMGNWTYNCIERTDLSPNFSDHADVDDKSFNIEARSVIDNSK